MWALAAALLAGLTALRRHHRRARVFAFINTEDAPKWRDQLAIFARALQLPDDCRWVEYAACAGHLPTQSDLRRLSGLLVTGSGHSVREQGAGWLKPLAELIRACEQAPWLRVVGCCFGCQAVAQALGGRVCPNPTGRFVYGSERISVAPALQGVLGLEDAACRLLESHGEQVGQMPPGAVLLGWSSTAPFEMFLAGRHRNVLGCQAHPEFSPGLMRDRIGWALVGKGRLSQGELEQAERSMGQPLDSEQVRARLYRDFLVSAGAWREIGWTKRLEPALDGAPEPP